MWCGGSMSLRFAAPPASSHTRTASPRQGIVVSFRSVGSVLQRRCVIDLGDALGQPTIELFLGHTVGETLRQGPRKTRNDPVVSGEPLVGLLLVVPAGKSDDPEAARVIDALLVLAGGFRQADLDHDLVEGFSQARPGVLGSHRIGLVTTGLGLFHQRVQFPYERPAQDFLAGPLVVFVLGHVDLRLDDRHQAARQDPAGQGKLLPDQCLDLLRLGGVQYQAPGLGPVDTEQPGALEERLEFRDRLQELDARFALHDLNATAVASVLGLVGLEALVDFQKGDDPLAFPQVSAGWKALDGPVHRVLK
mmetsp:Transcript_5918/g.12655  ORF Transcript_5918/g.12655 Transcript_5918/m.12655 type:complete len:306 (-) Transcript_5918:579-1496(-)